MHVQAHEVAAKVTEDGSSAFKDKSFFSRDFSKKRNPYIYNSIKLFSGNVHGVHQICKYMIMMI